jgi:hypothetical protein
MQPLRLLRNWRRMGSRCLTNPWTRFLHPNSPATLCSHRQQSNLFRRRGPGELFLSGSFDLTQEIIWTIPQCSLERFAVNMVDVTADSEHLNQ